MLTIKQRGNMRAFASSWLSECLDDLDEKDEEIVDLQTTTEGEIQHTDVMDRTVERLKRELVAKDEEIRVLKALNLQFKLAWAQRGDTDAKDERIRELEAEAKLLCADIDKYRMRLIRLREVLDK